MKMTIHHKIKQITMQWMRMKLRLFHFLDPNLSATTEVAVHSKMTCKAILS